MAKTYTLPEYIREFHSGNQKAFGESLTPPVVRQQVTKWLAMRCIVVDGELYSPRRPLHE